MITTKLLNVIAENKRLTEEIKELREQLTKIKLAPITDYRPGWYIFQNSSIGFYLMCVTNTDIEVNKDHPGYLPSIGFGPIEIIKYYRTGL